MFKTTFSNGETTQGFKGFARIMRRGGTYEMTTRKHILVIAVHRAGVLGHPGNYTQVTLYRNQTVTV